MKTLKKYLIVRPAAGMANRLRVLASAQIMASLTQRTLIVDWQKEKNVMHGSWRDYFKQPSLTTFEETDLAKMGYTSDQIYYQNVEGVFRVDEDSPILRNMQFLHIPALDDAIIYITSTWKFFPAKNFMNPENFNEQYKKFYESLIPTDLINQQIEEFMLKHKFEEKFMIGVHYRAWMTGKADKCEVSADDKHCYLQEFIDAMKRAVFDSSRETEKTVKFFLAADDPKVKAKLAQDSSLAQRILTREIKIDRSSIQGQQDALIDWFLLGNSNYIIGTSNSSFSDEAAYRTKRTQKINIGLSPYGEDEPSPEEILHRFG